MDVRKFRKADHEVEDVFINRRSSRAMSGEAIDEKELMSLFEAARWAPSSGNQQPWRFLYSLKGDEYWDLYFDLLNPGNKIWAKKAGALIITLSRKIGYKDRPNRFHSFDTGAAWENLALQGSVMGLVVHGIGGFDQERARKELEIPEEYNVEAMIVIGKPGRKEDLPGDLQERERPSQRIMVSEFAFRGKL